MRKSLLNLCAAALFSVASTAAWALSDVNGVYQIGTAADLEEFAALVNDGNVYACAELTADIDRGIDGTMIGVWNTVAYQGTFDGKGHTIKVNMYPEGDNAALFQYTGFGAIIQNLKVTGTITTTSKFAAGLVARNSGIIRGCYVDVTINSSVPGDATHGGIVGVGYGGCTVENCLAKITITGETTTNCGGVVGWAEKRTNIANCLVVSDGSTFAYSDASNGHSSNLARNEGCMAAIDVETYNANPYANRPKGACYNNYVTVDWGGTSPATTVVAYDDLADGRICYQLNNDQSRIAWVQTIGTDPFPVPAAFGEGQVYASGATDCDGKSVEELTFSNTPSNAITTPHSFDMYGVCSACGCFDFHAFEFDDPTKFDPTDRSVLLGTKEDIDKVEGWNRIAQGFRLNMKMVNDIEYIAEPGKYIFNPSDWIDGNFNGGGHVLTIGMSDMGDKAALFPEMDGNVENLILKGTITTSGSRAGSISGNARMALVRNVFSDIDITSSRVGDNTSGGFFGWTGDQEKTVENCIYAGTFTLPGQEGGAHCARVGGFSGWTATKTFYKNCAILGNIVGAGNETYDDDTENSQNIGRNPGNVVCENVYIVNPIEGNAVSDHDKYIHYENEDGIASGELAFFLNSKQNGLDRFYQLIGTDPEPMPIKKEGALVYCVAAKYSCDGTPIGTDVAYSNSASGAGLIPDHQFVDGWCVNCGKFDENFITPVDGLFEISNGAEFAWWSNYANMHKDACARLTDDIDMSDYMERFVPVEVFAGEFDGQGHTISYFVLETTKDYQGLFSTIAAGAKIHDFVVDETCSIEGNAFCGIIGGTSGGGNVYIYNVGNEGTVTTINQNAAGIVGVDQGGAMDMFITNCWVTGAVYGGRESGAICGYSSGGSIVKDCWAAFYIPQAGIYSSDSFTRGAAQVVNCYEADIEGVDPNKQQHVKPMADNRKCNALPLEDIESGALCYNLNGKQFTNPTWYQTLEDDAHPYPFNNHGVVINAAEQYFSIVDADDIPSIASEIQTYEEELLDDVVATTSLIDEAKKTIEALSETTSVAEFAEALEAVETAMTAVKQNAAVYQAYIDECERIKAYLATDNNFEGEERTALEAYLSEGAEPTEDNPLGTYEYIIENHTATAEEIAAETARVTKWLESAIKNGYMAGNDVSSVLYNSDFSKQNEGWTGGFGNSWGETTDTQTQDGKTIVGVEAWNATGDMYQTVDGLKPGYYLVGTHGAFRPSNNFYGTNYAAGIYANGIFNYFPAAIEDIVPVDEVEDGVNCNITIKSAYDFEVYGFDNGGVITPDKDGDVAIGYVVQGETGMAIAAKANRYQVYTIAYVGEDGKLTVGIKNPGTKYGSDWTGWGAIKLVYCGEADNENAATAYGIVLDNMVARANTILAYEPDEDNVAAGPNFPAELKTELQSAVNSYAEAQTIEAQAELAAKFSDIFQRVYEGKQAYVALYKASQDLYKFLDFNLGLIEKDEESGEWFATGETIFSEDEIMSIEDLSYEMEGAYWDGTYSTEEALTAATLKTPEIASIIPVPAQDEDGYYLIGTAKQFVVYRTIASEMDKYAKGKLTADIDMAGIAMLPIGHNKGENAVHIFAGEFDGQGHALTNVIIDDSWFTGMQDGDPATLFYELQNATVKNLKLTGDYHTMHQNMGGITRYMSGTSTIDNCEISLVLRSGINGDGTHGGVVGYCGSSNAVVSNCLVNNLMMSDEGVVTLHVGGVCGWGGQALTVKNTLITSRYENIGLLEAGDVNSNSVCRNQSNISNVYISSVFREQKGTLASAEQLASGEIAWKLNGQTADDAHWFQSLGVDATPHLFDGPSVYYYAGKYINEKPNVQLNAFAYNLDAKLAGKKVFVCYDLNAEAEAAEVQFFNGEDLVYTAVSNEILTPGTHYVVVDASELGSDPTALNFKVAVTGKGSLEVSRIGDSYKVWGPYGMAVNNNPASKNFGQVLLAESWVQDYVNGNNVYHTGDKVGALYAFDVDFQPINAADGTPGFYGGLDIAGETPLEIVNGYCLDLTDLRFSQDGRLFVARSGAASNSSVWEINPEDLNEPWKPVFTGGELDEQTGITYVGDDEQNRMAISLAFEGKGDDLKMYVLGGQRSNGEVNTTDYNCAFYNLGTATEWAAAASGYVEALDGVYTSTPYQAGIYADGQGGLWFIQRATASAETPAIKHFDAEGNEDYSNTSAQYGGGRMTVTADGNYLAIPTGTNTIVLYETNYVPMENGKIFLNPKQTIKVGESSIASLAFDYANNLYVASGGTETFSRYTIPGMNKLVVTPGNGIGIAALVGDLNNDGKVDIADAVSVLNIMAAGEYKEAADLNGDQRVDIADFVSVLNIMAAQ